MKRLQASLAGHEITIIKSDTIRTIIIGFEQKAVASSPMQIAYAINQVVNHRGTYVIMRLLEKITVRASLQQNDSLDVYNADDTFIASNCMELHANLIVSFYVWNLMWVFLRIMMIEWITC